MRKPLQIFVPIDVPKVKRARQASKPCPKCLYCNRPANPHRKLAVGRQTLLDLEARVFCSRLCGYHWAMERVAKDLGQEQA